MNDEVEHGIGEHVHIVDFERVAPALVAEERRRPHRGRGAEGDERLRIGFGVPACALRGLDPFS